MKITRISVMVLFLSLAAMGQRCSLAAPQGDEYYPAEEATELQALIWPRLVELSRDGAVVKWPGEPPRTLRFGERYREYELAAVIAQAAPLAVLERDFARWGVLAYIGTNGPIATLRKSVGRLDNLQPEKPFAADYSDRILNAQEDVLGHQVMTQGEEPSYESLAGLLPPLVAYTVLGTTTSRQKVIVWPDGRLGYGVHKQKLDEALFDPLRFVVGVSGGGGWARKQGLIGGYLPVIDYGFFDAATRSGWEEIAFATGAEDLETYVCLRSNQGKRTFWRLPGQQPLENGSDFYRALLTVKHDWAPLLTSGIRLEVPERRVSDSAKAAIVRALISEAGPHPKYGVGVYAAAQHDTFPPATILLNQCLLDWGFTAEVKTRLAYYLSHFVKPDGTFDYYGPAVSEYGQMLALAARYVRVTGDTAWLRENLPPIRRIAESFLAQLEASRNQYPPGSPYHGLLWGSAEADTRKDKRFYFSGDLWCVRGLDEMGKLLSEPALQKGDASLAPLGEKLQQEAQTLRGDVLAALARSFQKDVSFLPPDAGDEKPFERMTESELASYTNYRYWPEMLSSGVLPPEMRDAIIAYRTAHGGEVAGTTRLEDVLDDWPYANYAWGLMEAGQIEHYLLGFYGHLAFHETPGTFTAYESVAIKGADTRSYSSDYCVPAQLVEPQMLRWMIAWEPWDSQDLWLARAVPKQWFSAGFSADRIPTRWGEVNFRVTPNSKGLAAQVELTAPHPELVVHLSLRSAAAGAAPHVKVEGTKTWKWDSSQRAVELRGAWKHVTVTLENGG